jgi:hypothetical protein
MGLAHFMGTSFSDWICNFLSWAFALVFGRRDELREKLSKCKTYDEYRTIGLLIDEKENAAYKSASDDCEGVCDAGLLAQRAEKLEQLCQRAEPHPLAMALRTGTHIFILFFY